MSTYYISLTDNGSGVYTASAQRGGTAPSGGTSLPGGGSTVLANITTSQVGMAAEWAKLVCIDDRVAGN